MTCPEYAKYESGAMDENDFARHAAGCPACREAGRLDEEVSAAAARLRRRVEAPGLWDRIEASLKEELAQARPPEEAFQRSPRRIRDAAFFRRRFWVFVPAAAVILVGLGLGLRFALKSRVPASGLLTQSALARVEVKEREYLEAIRDLEKAALPRMAGLDLNLVFLYRERLAAIDSQIQKCREALSSNPANAHIRRYFLAALQDKKETLARVLTLEGKPGNT